MQAGSAHPALFALLLLHSNNGHGSLRAGDCLRGTCMDSGDDWDELFVDVALYSPTHPSDLQTFAVLTAL